MARRRRVDHPGVHRFADGRLETWLTDPDRAAVEAAGNDMAKLAELTGGRWDLMRLSTIRPEQQQAWALSKLAAGRRCRAIVAWAEVNNIDTARALDHFIGEPRVLSERGS